MNGQK